MSIPKIRKQIQNRILKTGDTFSGDVFTGTGYGAIDTSSTNLLLGSLNVQNNFQNGRFLELRNSNNTSTPELNKAISLTSAENGTWKAYQLYGEHNKPAPADIGAATSEHNHNSLLGTLGASTGIKPPTNAGVLRYDYNVSQSVAGTLPTLNNANGVITMNTHSGNYYAQLGFSSNGKLYHRNFNGSALNDTAEWGQVYTSQSKPTPADIGAAPASHTHSISNITNLQSSLDSKINDSTLFKYMHSDFTVEGNANTYYPVFFPCYGSDSHFTGYTLKIGRMYNEAAPDTWNTSTHRGGLTLNIRWSGDYGWGGNGHNFIVEYFEESYCNLVAGIEMCTISFNEGICVWLRGGGALYHAACEYGIPIPKIYYSSFTANNGAVWSPKTSVTSYWWAPYTATTRYPHNVISTGPNGSFYENYTKGNLSCIQSSTPGNTKMLWAW